MAKIWQVLTENAVSKKQVNFNVVEMSDIDATMAIQEAHYEAGAVMSAVHDIAESILEFGIEADRKDLTAMEYIAEAFDFGGFFRKIFDFLIKMWNTVVNYLRALIGNKLGASGNIVKLIIKIGTNLEMLKARTFDDDAEITIKDYTEITGAIEFAKVLVSPATYLETALLDKVESKLWSKHNIKNSETSSVNVGSGNFNIVNITAGAAGLAAIVENLKSGRAAGDTTNAKGDTVGGGRRTSGTAIGDYSTDVEKAVTDVKAFNSKLSLGEKGAVESFTLLFGVIAKNKKGSTIATTMDKAKLKDAKSLTELIRSLLTHFFPASVATRSIKGDSNIKSQISILEKVMFHGGDGDATDFGRSDNAGSVFSDPIKFGLKICEDILSELKRAATVINSFKKEDLVEIDAAGEVKDGQDASGKLAEKMTEFGKELMSLESGMQAVITKGMDAGATILEVTAKEVLAQTEIMLKAPTLREKKASVENTK